MKKRHGRLRSGASLVETLVAVLILALLAGAIFTGSRAALASYQKSTFVSECQLVSDTVNNALSDVLRYASFTADEAGTVTSFANSTYGVGEGEGVLTVANGIFYLTAAVDDPEDETQPINPAAVRLLSEAAYSYLRVEPSDFSLGNSEAASIALTLTESGGVVSGSYRLYDPVNQQLSEVYTFHFRSVNE